MDDLFPFVSVEWNDAWADGTDTLGEHEHDTKHKPTVMETRGWLLGDNEAGVSLFNERCLDKGDGTYRSRTFIPRALVLSVTPWKLVRPRKPKQPKQSSPETPKAPSES